MLVTDSDSNDYSGVLCCSECAHLLVRLGRRVWEVVARVSCKFVLFITCPFLKTIPMKTAGEFPLQSVSKEGCKRGETLPIRINHKWSVHG